MATPGAEERGRGKEEEGRKTTVGSKGHTPSDLPASLMCPHTPMCGAPGRHMPPHTFTRTLSKLHESSVTQSHTPKHASTCSHTPKCVFSPRPATRKLGVLMQMCSIPWHTSACCSPEPCLHPPPPELAAEAPTCDHIPHTSLTPPQAPTLPPPRCAHGLTLTTGVVGPSSTCTDFQQQEQEHPGAHGSGQWAFHAEAWSGGESTG